MQRTLLIKTVVIIVVLLVFVFGIFGKPDKFSGDGLKQAVLNRIHLGLDLKGGMHLILQVMLDEAIGSRTDPAIERIEDEMGERAITYTQISTPDPRNPDKILL